MSTPKYPKVHVNLIGEDGNAFFIIGRTMKALRHAKVPQAEIDAFMNEAQSGDYSNVLRTVCAWVTTS